MIQTIFDKSIFKHLTNQFVIHLFEGFENFQKIKMV
jgi:hypothetical protein